MMASTLDVSPIASEGKDGQPCYLLNLPLELQLPIYELATAEEEILLLNCPCNSSYRGSRRWQLDSDSDAWEAGEKHPPMPPAITQTCQSIRRASLPMFYQQNVFRASYCASVVMLPGPTRWLERIGQANREALRHLYFYDRNEMHDRSRPRNLKDLKECGIFTEMGGRLETMSGKECCAHQVLFGEHEQRSGEVPIALQPGAKLRVEDEE